MDKQNFDEFLYDLSSDTESSSSSNPYESQPFILDLHEISKENPNPENVKKIRKTKKKKKNRSQASVSSESTTNSTVTVPAVVEELPREELPREEFYDAHESYHDLPENQTSNPVAIVAIAQAHSEHGQDPKLLDPKAVDPKAVEPKAVDPNAPDSKVQEAASTQGQTSEAQKQPSAITKPVTGPE